MQTIARPKPFKTIDLLAHANSPGLHARLAWQVLFDEYRANGGSLDQMDHMLIDYSHLLQISESRGKAGLSWSLRWSQYGDTTAMECAEQWCAEDSVIVMFDANAWCLKFYRQKAGDRHDWPCGCGTNET